MTGSVANVKSQMNRLSALGITVSDQGRLVLNSAKLDDALAGGVEGVSEANVRRLFALDGQSDHAGIRFVLGSAATKASNTDYQVDITQAAERATVLAGSALAGTTTIDGSNNTLSLTVDGQASATLTLTAGSYSQSQLAAHLQEVIDADAELKGRSVRVTVESGRLRITSDSYGSSSEITVGAGTALGDLKFTLGQTDAGQDVAGRFLVNGVEETAQGTGQILVGEDDNANTAGLQLRITLTSSQVVPGSEANLTVTRGIASRLEQTLSQMLDPVDGRLKGINDAVQDRVSKIDEEVQRLNDLIDSRRDSLVRQFAALEDAISQMQSTSSFLSAQLGNLTNLRVSGQHLGSDVQNSIFAGIHVSMWPDDGPRKLNSVRLSPWVAAAGRVRKTDVHTIRRPVGLTLPANPSPAGNTVRSPTRVSRMKERDTCDPSKLTKSITPANGRASRFSWNCTAARFRPCSKPVMRWRPARTYSPRVNWSMPSGSWPESPPD